MEAFLYGTRLLIPRRRDVYWFERENGDNNIGLNSGRTVEGSRLIRLPEYIAQRFIDQLDVLASQFPEKDEVNPEYTSKRRAIIDFAERELGPYMEPVI